MKQRSIIFNGEMVRAILEGRKTQTRRVVKFQDSARPWLYSPKDNHIILDNNKTINCPFGQPGDKLWVRETWANVPRTAYRFNKEKHPHCWQTPRPDDNHDAAVYKEGWTRCDPGRWKSPVTMPRWASRITLEITDVRVERVQDISHYDAKSEMRIEGDGEGHYHADLPMGVDYGPYKEPEHAFKDLWDSINAKGGHGWDSNPWVWVLKFKKVQS